MRIFKTCRPLLVFSILANILMLIAPLHMLQVYDRVLTSGSSETLLFITLIAAAFLCLFGVIEAIRNILAQRISSQFAVNAADPLFDGMTNGVIPAEKSNEIIRDFNVVQSFVASRTMIGLFDLPFSPVFLFLLYLLHFQLGLLATFGLFMLIGIAWLNNKSTAEDQEKANKANGEATGFASAIASRSEDIRAMGMLPTLVQRWGGIMGESLNARDQAAKQSAMFLGISRAARQILQISIMAWGAWLVLNGDMSGGMIFAASMISQRSLQPVEQVIAGWEQIKRAKQANAAIDEILSAAKSSEKRVRQPEPIAHLKVENLSLRIESLLSQPIDIINDISFELTPGELTVIVGPSGAGKSTVARIIAGAMEATSGDIYLHGCSQKNWPSDQWGENVGYVGQDIQLFPGTVAENISRMAVEPDERRIIEAANMAGAHDLINSFPDGYLTRLGTSGFRLSGGQKQRIALARALYTNPKLLVLDEPNAHLDKEGEAVLMNSIKRIKENGAAVLVVAQRQQILKIADKVLMIKDGKQVPLQSLKKKAEAFESKKVDSLFAKTTPHQGMIRMTKQPKTPETEHGAADRADADSGAQKVVLTS